MSLESIKIKRICLHEIYHRNNDRTINPPNLSNVLLKLQPKEMSIFCERVLDAFDRNSQCIEMAIRKYDNNSTFYHGTQLSTQTDQTFTTFSQIFANRLAEAQTRRDTPGGLVVVFDGTLGTNSVPFFAIMKAEFQTGFIKTQQLQATFVEQLFLSQKSKLYKIGLFINNSATPAQPLPNGWQAIVYDDNMTASKREAATYFYDTFLGLDFPQNAAQQVKAFFEYTREFIKTNSSFTKEQKHYLYNAVSTYLQLPNKSVVQTTDFASNYLNSTTGPEYLKFMALKKFPTKAISRDTSEIANKLKTRKITFQNKIILTAPPSSMKNDITLESIKDSNGQVIETKLIIKGDIEKLE